MQTVSENETVEDIVADIRAQNQGLPEGSYALSPLVCDLLSFADRIEAACHQPVTDCNALGNAAKMRSVLEAAYKTLKLVYENTVEFIQPRLADEIIHTGSAIESALSGPPRNCDRFTTAKDAIDAWLKIDDDSYGALEPFDWLFSPAEEGGAK